MSPFKVTEARERTDSIEFSKDPLHASATCRRARTSIRRGAPARTHRGPGLFGDGMCSRTFTSVAGIAGAHTLKLWPGLLIFHSCRLDPYCSGDPQGHVFVRHAAMTESRLNLLSIISKFMFAWWPEDSGTNANRRRDRDLRKDREITHGRSHRRGSAPGAPRISPVTPARISQAELHASPRWRTHHAEQLAESSRGFARVPSERWDITGEPLGTFAAPRLTPRAVDTGRRCCHGSHSGRSGWPPPRRGWNRTAVRSRV
jgi:hypothetical protein